MNIYRCIMILLISTCFLGCANQKALDVNNKLFGIWKSGILNSSDIDDYIYEIHFIRPNKFKQCVNLQGDEIGNSFVAWGTYEHVGANKIMIHFNLSGGSRDGKIIDTEQYQNEKLLLLDMKDKENIIIKWDTEVISYSLLRQDDIVPGRIRAR